MRAVLLALAAGMLAMSPVCAEGKVTATTKARYSTEEGRSKWYELEVQFVTGGELNTATRSYRYQSYRGYAVIFFGEGKAAVIELSNSMIGCGSKYTLQCLPSISSTVKGKDQDGTEWEICTGSYC